MTYLALNAVFLTVVVVVLVAGVRAARRRGVPMSRSLAAVGLSLLVLLVMTAVFDNLMISAGLVAYDDAQRVGLSIGVAPIEDFAYSVAAALLLPAVWHLLGARRRRAGESSAHGTGAGSGRLDP
ncbi:lycopene cyclase domain-containing protein [Actinotalea sp. K2]|uniref:lycopene cyclase domain-containing protein n=1 Tax=Actinotalea sp. K2 TaxID=2939438 RepID=UPI002016E6CF|nr:lycopene cyclase domain-containing protein [Actinotalea sp. K2]MCL3859724.1 lycopene cyclase domain-containing protein [Actinotalea sp. K2]